MSVQSKPKESISSLKRKLAEAMRQKRELSSQLGLTTDNFVAQGEQCRQLAEVIQERDYEIESMALTIAELRREVIALRDASQTIEHHPEWAAINPIHDPRTCGKSHPTGKASETVTNGQGTLF